MSVLLFFLNVEFWLINTKFNELKQEGKNWPNRAESSEKSAFLEFRIPPEVQFRPKRLSKKP
jgi:hypothetical protein